MGAQKRVTIEKTILKRVITISVAVISAILTVVFTLLCMKNFKDGFLYDHATVITSLAVGVEVLCVAAAVVCLAKKFETVFKFLLTAFVIAAVVLVGLYILQVTGIWETIESIETLRKAIDSAGIWAPLAFIVLQSLQVFLLPLPGVLTVGVGVALFGELETCLYSYIGILIGSIIAFWIGRVIGYKAAAWLVGKEALDKWQEKVRGKDRMILTAMFVLPLFPDDILCFVAGLSTMTWKYYIIMQLIARAISVVATSYSVGGSIIPYTTWWGILIWILIGAAIIALFVLLWKKGEKLEKWFFSLFRSKGKNDIALTAEREQKISEKSPAEEPADTEREQGKNAKDNSSEKAQP